MSSGTVITNNLKELPKEELTYQICLDSIRKYPWQLEYVEAQFRTPELLMAAVKEDGRAIQFINKKEQTYEICLAAVRRNGEALKFVDERFQTPELCHEAVNENWEALRYVKNQTPEMCMEAITAPYTGCYRAFSLIHKPTLEMAFAAVTRSRSALENMRLGDVYLSHIPEVCLEAVKHDGLALKYVHNKTPEVCLEAVKQDGWAFMYVEKKTPEICLEAVKQNAQMLQYVAEKTPTMCLEAVKQNGTSLEYVPKEMQTLPMALAALRQNIDCRSFLADQFRTKEVYEAVGFHDYTREDLASPQMEHSRTQDQNRG